MTMGYIVSRMKMQVNKVSPLTLSHAVLFIPSSCGESSITHKSLCLSSGLPRYGLSLEAGKHIRITIGDNNRLLVHPPLYSKGTQPRIRHTPH